jgi:hypothetical protein
MAATQKQIDRYRASNMKSARRPFRREEQAGHREGKVKNLAAETVRLMQASRVQEDGTAFVDLSKLTRPKFRTVARTRDQAAAIQEIHTKEDVEGRNEDRRSIRKVKFKLAEKKGALDFWRGTSGCSQDRAATSRVSSPTSNSSLSCGGEGSTTGGEAMKLTRPDAPESVHRWRMLDVRCDYAG